MTYDVLCVALKLAPHSNSLRAMIALTDRQKPRLSDAQLVAVMRPLVEAVMDRLGVNSDGEFGGDRYEGTEDPQQFAGALRYMRNVEYFETEAFEAQQWAAVRAGVDPQLLEWADRLVRRFRRFDCPLYIRTGFLSLGDVARMCVMGEDRPVYQDDPYPRGKAIELAHCLFGRDLPEFCWRAIFKAGLDLARSMRLELSWSNWRYDDGTDSRVQDGDPRPWHWEVADWRNPAVSAPREAVIDPSRYNFSRSPPGEREMLEKWYGIK